MELEVFAISVDHPTANSDRALQVSRVLWIVLAGNILVATAKVVIGILSGSASVLSDGFHSVADASNNVVGLVGIHLASRPRDANHPYGHGKIETFTGLLIGGFLMAVAFEMIRHTIERISSAKPIEITPLGMGILGMSAVANFTIFLFERSSSRRLGSEILLADSAHTATDIGITLTILAGLFGVRKGWYWLDTALALGVILFIGRAAYQILIQSGQVLIDTQALPVERIQEVASGIIGVERSYRIRSRGRHNEVFVDLHISVHPQMTTERAHQIATEVERAIRNRLPGVVEVIVHVEPEPSRPTGAPPDSSSP
ncbi:MAG: cation diffusion facilitator family transporter [bacterium JZ-2024 1]